MPSWQVQQLLRKIKEKLFIVKDKMVILTRNKYVWMVSFLILLFVSGFYINSYTAHVVELQKKTEQEFSGCEKNLVDCEKNANTTQQQLTVCKLDLTNIQSNLSTCTDEKMQLEKESKNISFDLLSCQQTYSSLSSTCNTLRTDYEALANKSAINICCKRKLDDPNLKYFYIDNNSIVCTTASSDKTKEFVCPSLT